MVNVNPDKWIRKAVHGAINNIAVSGKTIQCFDSRAINAPDTYVLLTVQTKEIERANKCKARWTTSLLIELYNKVTSSGNTASRLLLNDIEEVISNNIYPGLVVEGFQTLDEDITYEAQFETITDNEIILRSFIRLNLTLI